MQKNKDKKGRVKYGSAFLFIEVVFTPTYTNFQGLLNSFDIIVLIEVLAGIPILPNGATTRADSLGNDLKGRVINI